MKLLRKGAVALFTAVLMLAIGLFASACAPKKVRISFETNGGADCAAIEVVPGEEFTLPDAGEYTGHFFEGWYETADFSGSPVSGKVIAPETDATYYAKWSSATEVKLNADGGTISGSSTLYLKPGANLYDAVRTIVPTKGSLEFGGWFLNGEELSTDATVSSEAIELLARYKVEYSVNYYLKSLDGDFVLSETKGTGKDYVGASVKAEVKIFQGFTYARENAANEAEIASLDEDPEANVMQLYYEREVYEVSFSAGLPAGYTATGSIPSQFVAYEDKVSALPENVFKAEGLRFAGWGTTAGGEVEYEEGAEFVVRGNSVIYAIWDVGMTDRFGSYDILFFPREDTTTAILSRGGYEFFGERDGNNFTFTVSEDIELKGMATGTNFVFLHEAVAGDYTYIDAYFRFTEMEEPDADPKNDSISLTVDEYLNASITLPGQDGALVELNGWLAYDNTTGAYLFFNEEDGLPYLGVVFPDTTQYPEYDKCFMLMGNEMGVMYGAEEEDLAILLDGVGGMMLADYMNSMTYEGLYTIDSIIYYYDSTGNTVPAYTIRSKIYDEYGMFAYSFFGDMSFTPGWVDFDFRLEPTYNEQTYELEYVFYLRDTMYSMTYTGEDGDELILDGYGALPDSAVWKSGKSDKVYCSGTYYTTLTVLNGVLCTVTDYETDLTYGFLIKQDGTFEAVEYDDYDYLEFVEMLMGEETGPHGDVQYVPVLGEYALVLHETDDMYTYGMDLYKEKEDEPDKFELAAKGTATLELMGTSVLQFSFESTETIIDGTMESCKFGINDYMVTATNGSLCKVFYFWEIDGVSAFEETYTGVEEEEGSKIETLEISQYYPFGSIYTDSNGNVYEGSLILEETRFGVSVGYFYYIDMYTGSLSQFVFEVNTEENTFHITNEVEIPCYTFDESGSLVTEIASLILFGDQAIYVDNTGEEILGTADIVDTTIFGDDIYAFTPQNGVELFRFMLGTTYVQDYYYGTIQVAFYLRYNEEFSGTFYSEEEGELEMDGFFTAELLKDGVLYSGNYTVAVIDGDTIVIFQGTDGTEYVAFLFLFDEDGFYALDDAYSEMLYLVDESWQNIGDEYHIKFDGHGGVVFYQAILNDWGDVESYETLGTGTYEIAEETASSIELIVTREFENEFIPKVFRATFEVDANMHIYNCVIRDDESASVFADEYWNVLALDGYGNGVVYLSDGTIIEGTYKYLSKDLHYVLFTDANYSGLYLVIDPEKREFSQVEFLDETVVYYSSDFEGIGFGWDGLATFGGDSGTYLVKDGKTYVFLVNMDGSLQDLVELDFEPGEKTFEYNGKEFRLFEEEQEITLNGTVKFVDEDGEELEGYEAMEGTLTFTLDGRDAAFMCDSVEFTVGEETYHMGLRNTVSQFVVDPGSEQWQERIVFGTQIYTIEPYYYYDISLTYNFNGGGTFVALGGEVHAVSQDGYDMQSEITSEYVGYGPINLTGTHYSGTLYYGTDGNVSYDPIEFESDEHYILGVNDYTGMETQMIVLENEEGKYAVVYYDYGDSYALYLFAKYSEGETTVEEKDYTVGVGTFAFANSYDFTSYKVGDRAFLAVFEGTGEEKVSVEQFDAGFNKGGKEGWFISMGDRQVGTTYGDLGECYLITFAEGDEVEIESMEVMTYQQAFSTSFTGYYQTYFIHFFVDEDGNATPVAIAEFDEFEWGYFLMPIESFEEIENGFRITCEDGTVLEATFVLEDGEKVENEDGSWQMDITAPAQA